MDKFLQLKNEFATITDFLHKVLPDTDLTDEWTLFYVAACLKIWGSNQLYSPDYKEALNKVTGSDFTIEQIVTAMGCCADEERELIVPDFFRILVKQDQKLQTSNVSDFIADLNELLISSSMINGDFTVEEANILSSIMDLFVNAAQTKTSTLSFDYNYQLKITERNDDSYLKNNRLATAAWEDKAGKRPEKLNEEKTEKKDNTADADDADDTITIPINISFSIDDEAIADKLDKESIASAPEEAPAVTTPSSDDGETLESLLEELDGLVGLEIVKKDVHSLMNFIKVTNIRKERGMQVPTISYHLVFTGNPGTGKTTVARLVAKLYYHMGILPKGQLVETDRSALVAGYLGQTAIKTQKVIQQAMGGVLFIDEAYSLAGETDDSYGKEAIETILKAMEDHRDELIVIVAGYTELMHKFIDSNPGLSSRFSKYFEFPDYTGDELLAIFERFCEKNGYSLAEDARTLLSQLFAELYENRDDHFGNARTARNIFEKAINMQANRVAAMEHIQDQDLVMITVEDISSAIGGERQ